MLGRQVRRHVARGVTRHGEALHRHPVRAVGPDLQRRHARNRAPAPRRAGRAARCSCAGPAPSSTGASVRQACASAAMPSTFGVPASCRCGAGAHAASSRSTRGDGPAAREVGRRGVEPVATADERARPVGRVELVPGQRDVVHARRREVDPAVRGELCGVDGDPGARGVRDRHDPVQRQHLAGDVGRPGHGEQRRRGGAQRAVEIGERLRDRRAPRAACGASRRARAAGSRGARRRGTGPAPGTAVASRFSASVVLRVKTTTSSSARAPTNSPTHSRARSSSAVLTCER